MTRKLVIEQEMYHCLEDLVSGLGDIPLPTRLQRLLRRANKILAEYEKEVNRAL